MKERDKPGKIDFTNEQILIESEESSSWRTKSFQANPLQAHPLPLQPMVNMLTNIFKVQAPQLIDKMQQRVPKILKINNLMFAVLLNNMVTVFCYVSNQQKLKRKMNKNFFSSNLNIQLPTGITHICSDKENKFFLANSEELVGVELTVSETEISSREIFREKIAEIKGVSFYKTNKNKKLAIVTAKELKLCNLLRQVDNIDEEFSTSKNYTLEFSSESTGLNNLNSVNGIEIIPEDINTLYFVSSAEEKRQNLKEKLGRGDENDGQPESKKCEALYITKLKLNNSSEKAEARIFIIDFIFELGIFKRSRVHQAGSESFILSLFEEVIVIRRNFDKYIVWDNVSVAPSRSNQKRAEILLAGNRILLSSESGEIFVNQFYFDQNELKLKLPMIDTLKGNDNDEQTMYDALILQYEPKTYMSLIFYFKITDIDLPNSPRPPNPNQSDSKNSSVSMSLLCVQQINPTARLKTLLRNNKPPEQVDAFIRRFAVSELVTQKCMWQVSSKTEKQIEGILLQIKDIDYIQVELTNILKSRPHDLTFLLRIETKQIERFRKMLATKLLKLKQLPKSPVYLKKKQNKTIIVQAKFSIKQIGEIKQALAWLLESKMFEKKLKYSQNFLSFKEYDFIEIGKLKAASLREEIKLLGCKGFEKRLKYFLNSFKYLILDDFKNILRFFLIDMNQFELKIALAKNFAFILPTYKYKEGEDECYLWEDSFQKDITNIETPNIFKKQIHQQIQQLIAQKCQNHERISEEQAMSKYQQIFSSFIEEDWYKKNSYKQHSLLKHSLQQLKRIFVQLKEDGVFRIITELMYQKVEEKKFSAEKVRTIIDDLTREGLFEEDFKMNMYVRNEVYDLIKDKKVLKYEYSLPSRSTFINWTEGLYFKFLFEFFQSIILSEISEVYEKQKEDFFRKRFKMFLYSKEANLPDLIGFLHYFTSSSHEKVREQLTICISKLLKFSDIENTKKLILLLMDKQVVYTDEYSTDNPVPQAKLVLFAFFAPLFNHFKLQCSYYDIFEESLKKDPKQVTILNSMIQKYCKQFDSQKSVILEFDKAEYLEEIPSIDLSQTLDFLAIVLYLRSMVHYEISDVNILEKILIEFLLNQKYTDADTFVGYLFGFNNKPEQAQLMENYAHYGMINTLKQNSLKKELQDIILRFVQNKHVEMDKILTEFAGKKKEVTKEQLKQLEVQIKKETAKILLEISESLTILNKYVTNDKVIKQIRYLSLLQNTKTLNFQAMAKINSSKIQNFIQFISQTNFQFLMNILSMTDPTAFNLDDSEQISSQIATFKQIHTDYGYVQRGQSANEELIFSEYCRFVCQFIVYLVDKKYFKSAAYNLFEIMKTNYYYRQAFFYFLIRVINPEISSSIIETLIYTFLTETDSEKLMILLDNFFMVHKIKQFSNLEFYRDNTERVFFGILINNQLDESFFSLLRNQEFISLPELQQKIKGYPKYKEEAVAVHKLLLQYLVVLKLKKKVKNFPTFELYKSKYSSLCKEYERMDIIKDIYILLVQIELQIFKIKQNTEYKEKLTQNHQLLQNFYNQYMKVNQIDPELSNLFEKEESSHNKIEKYVHQNEEFSIAIHSSGGSDNRKDKKISKNMEQLVNENKKLLQNEFRLRQIKQKNKALLEEEITPAITQAKKRIEEQKKLQDMSLLQRKQMKKKDPSLQDFEIAIKADNEFFQKIKNQELEKIQEMKEGYHSQTAEKAQKKLQQLRNQRIKFKEELGLTTKASDPDQHAKMAESGEYKVKINQPAELQGKSSGVFRVPEARMRESTFFDNKSSRILGYQGLKASIMNPKDVRNTVQNMKESTFRLSKRINDKNSQFYVPKRTINAPKSLEEDFGQEELKNSMKIEKLRKSILTEREREKQKKEEQKPKIKFTIQQIKMKYAAIQPETIPYFEKLLLIKNSTKGGMEIIKSIYAVCRKIQNFKGICTDLLENSDFAKEYIEEKALKLLQQAIKIKVNLPFKQLFPSSLFVTIKHVSLKDYYHIAFGLIKPELLKLMENVSVNSLAVVIRQAFGADNTFYYKVYEQHIKYLVHRFETSKVFPQRERMQMTDKLQNDYKSLSADPTKAVKLERAFMDIKDKDRRNELIQMILQDFNKKSSLSSKETITQIQNILTKIRDKSIV